MPPVPTTSSSSYLSAMTSPTTPAFWLLALGERRFERRFPGGERLVHLGVTQYERREDADAVRIDARLQQQQAGRDRLRHRHEVGLASVVVDPPLPPGAAEAGLHLVDHEDDPVLVADPADTREEVRRGDDEATLALHRLDHDRGHALGRDLR